jgi:hypothetical protein
MKRLVLLLAAGAVMLAFPAHARAVGECGLPSTAPLWIDFGDGSVPFWQVLAKEGTIVAAAGEIYPPQIRARGAQTVYFDRNFTNRVGTPSAPKDPDTIEARANRLFELAVPSSGCDKPLIALNELFGASLETPWSVTNTQYRANVMRFLRTLAARGGRPFLLISSTPYTSGEAGDWWREAAKYADLVPEVYFSAPTIHKLGPIVGNRRLRMAMRRAVRNFTELGIPSSKIGIMLGFQTGRGAGGREGLEPASAWFETVKWQALAARQVARETSIATIWSWGWGAWSDAARDPDKEAAACVYLWTRDPSLCDGPAAAGPEFDTSLTEGQIRLARGQQCSLLGRSIPSGALSALARVTGDREVAYTVLLARLAESSREPVSTARILAAERAVVALRFRGNAAAYRAALARAGATVAIGRGVLADELRRLSIEARLRARRPSAREVSSFYFSYPDLLTRAVEAKPAPWWLGGRTRGLAFAPLAPQELFALPAGRQTSMQALDGTYQVRVVGDVLPLGSVPFSQARTAISGALSAFARRGAFEDWTVARQEGALQTAICRGDDLPASGTIRLAGYLPFLSLAGA